MLATLQSFDAARSTLSAAAADKKGLAPEILEAVLRANFDGLRACTGRVLAREPGAERRLKVRVALEANGSVVQAEPLESTFADQASVPCIVEKLRNVRFPPPRGGAASVQLKLGFQG